MAGAKEPEGCPSTARRSTSATDTEAPTKLDASWRALPAASSKTGVVAEQYHVVCCAFLVALDETQQLAAAIWPREQTEARRVGGLFLSMKLAADQGQIAMIEVGAILPLRPGGHLIFFLRRL